MTDPDNRPWANSGQNGQKSLYFFGFSVHPVMQSTLFQYSSWITSYFTNCGCLTGIRHAKSVAYLSRSNGRAEVTARQLFGRLRKIWRGNWFPEMWPALKAHHDTPTSI